MPHSLGVESVASLLKERQVIKMAWRPTEYLIEGMFDNTNPNKVIGWMKFVGMKPNVIFDLEGNFHRDIRGTKIHFTGDAYEDQKDIDGEKYMKGFASHHTGKAGDITAGLPPHDYGSTPYIEVYSDQNGRIVIELEPVQIEVVGSPIPICESDPISREQQGRNMGQFLASLTQAANMPAENAVCVGGKTVIKASKRAMNNKIRGMKLLTQEIRKKLPPLYAQDGKGGKAVVYVKYFTPSSSWTWYITEGEPVLDAQSKEVDFKFFGLVEGHEKELGYVLLSELEEVRGPMGLPIERDLYFKPKTLEEIEPEMFKEVKNNER
jgi:hypothetical protein